MPVHLNRAAAKAKGSHLRVHFKNTVEVVNAIRGMKLERAKAYLKNVLEHKEAVPFTHFKGGRGRHAQVRTIAPRRVKLSATCVSHKIDCIATPSICRPRT
jgi:large subunit ribosomal protein L17e